MNFEYTNNVKYFKLLQFKFIIKFVLNINFECILLQ